MSDRLRLRPARNEDGDALARLIAAVFAEYPGCIFDREAEFPELDAIAGDFAAKGGAIWVAEQDGAVIGSLGIVPLPEGGAELHKLYVDAAARGSGAAPALLGQALAWARTRGCAWIELWSDQRFTRGHRFYEKHGFRRTGAERVLDDLSCSAEFHYRREL